jgi:hypothetical protein
LDASIKPKCGKLPTAHSRWTAQTARRGDTPPPGG